mmetsp:Transcript_67172/g.160578  ORF Transcript_67172/g.160578 Transcript_67172/m.160578 type:complete len:565 (-) Transcript_67172:102-1796(-)
MEDPPKFDNLLNEHRTENLNAEEMRNLQHLILLEHKEQRPTPFEMLMHHTTDKSKLPTSDKLESRVEWTAEIPIRTLLQNRKKRDSKMSSFAIQFRNVFNPAMTFEAIVSADANRILGPDSAWINVMQKLKSRIYENEGYFHQRRIKEIASMTDNVLTTIRGVLMSRHTRELLHQRRIPREESEFQSQAAIHQIVSGVEELQSNMRTLVQKTHPHVRSPGREKTKPEPSFRPSNSAPASPDRLASAPRRGASWVVPATSVSGEKTSGASTPTWNEDVDFGVHDALVAMQKQQELMRSEHSTAMREMRDLIEAKDRKMEAMIRSLLANPVSAPSSSESLPPGAPPASAPPTSPAKTMVSMAADYQEMPGGGPSPTASALSSGKFGKALSLRPPVPRPADDMQKAAQQGWGTARAGPGPGTAARKIRTLSLDMISTSPSGVNDLPSPTPTLAVNVGTPRAAQGPVAAAWSDLQTRFENVGLGSPNFSAIRDSIGRGSSDLSLLRDSIAGGSNGAVPPEESDSPGMQYSSRQTRDAAPRNSTSGFSSIAGFSLGSTRPEKTPSPQEP